MEDQIKQALRQIESDEKVRIVYACESGSRAWGFPSEDSDYDVRFLYVRPRDWYLSIDVENKPDTIELPITDILDISGWDIRKAMQLLRKSNPPLLEWFSSPTIYLEVAQIADRLRAVAPECYSPIACAHHYLHMARGNYREYLKNDPVWQKKYFYILRPLLAIKWIEQRHSPVPMEFGTLVEQLVTDNNLKCAIEDLVEEKKKGRELDHGPKIPVISEYIESELKRIETQLATLSPSKPATEKLNETFRFSLDAAWSSNGIQ
jgi:predicted nucleotidyltransferase